VTDWTREFPFELRVCAWAERDWPPDGALADGERVLVGRQFGTHERRWDTVVVVADAEGLRQRARFGEHGLDRNLLRVVRHAPAEFEWYRDALPEWTSWRYVREAVHDAADRGIIEKRKDGNRLELRRKWPYPDWLDSLIAIENKPDLDRSAARRLADQLEIDVALSLADEAWVATLQTGERVEPALLADVPVQAGVLAVDPEAFGGDAGGGVSADTGADGDVSAASGAGGGVSAGPGADVLWHPRELAVDDPGTRIVDRPDGGDYDHSAARFEYVDPEWKALTRLGIAERVYERGWRSYVDQMRPDCRHFGLTADSGQLLPTCAAKGHCPSTWECAGRCSEFEPEPPAWRSKGWPIEGGPGKGLRALLEDRRARERPE